MKFLNIVFFLVVLVIACTAVFAEEEGSKRNSILRRPSPRGAPKTTTTTPAPAEEEEIGDEEYDNQEYENEGEKESADATSTTTTTSTEAPKKIGPIIRPFRTNDDFLNSLKRRQQNAKKAIKEKTTPKPRAEVSEDDSEDENEPAPAPVSQSKFKSNSALSRRKPSSKPVAEEAAEQAEEAAPASVSGRRPGRLSLKPRN